MGTGKASDTPLTVKVVNTVKVSEVLDVVRTLKVLRGVKGTKGPKVVTLWKRVNAVNIRADQVQLEAFANGVPMPDTRWRVGVGAGTSLTACTPPTYLRLTGLC